MLLFGDGVVVDGILHGLHAGHGELESGGRALVPPCLAAHFDRRLHLQRRDARKGIRAAARLLRHALNPARAVAELEERDLAL